MYPSGIATTLLQSAPGTPIGHPRPSDRLSSQISPNLSTLTVHKCRSGFKACSV